MYKAETDTATKRNGQIHNHCVFNTPLSITDRIIRQK